MKNFLNRRGKKRGFTLIELLVVVLILAILMAVALPLYLSSVADAETKTCRANLQTIANATQAYRVKMRLSNATPTMAQLLPDLQATPACPKAGTYSIASNATTDVPEITCTLHGMYSPGMTQ